MRPLLIHRNKKPLLPGHDPQSFILADLDSIAEIHEYLIHNGFPVTLQTDETYTWDASTPPTIVGCITIGDEIDLTP